MALVLDGSAGVSGVDGTASNPSYEGTDSNTGIFFPAADTIAFAEGGAEVARFDSAGNFGLGTQSPAASLSVVKQTTALSGTGNSYGLYMYPTSSGLTYIDAITGSTGNTSLGFRTYNNGIYNEMRMDSSGNVGIGETSPAAPLHIKSATNNIMRLQSSDATTGNLYFSFYNSSGTQKGYIGYGNSGDDALQIQNEANSYMTFATNGTERARITSDGYLLLGKTATATGTAGITFGATADLGYSSFSRTSSTNAEVTLQVYSTGAAANRFYVGMAGTVFATSTTITGISDVRLKENIRDLDDGLNAVLALQPRKFDWKEGKGANIKNARGFIAQEFEQVFPDMIEQWIDEPPEGEEHYKAVNANLIPVLVKAIQEQQAMIDEMKAEIAALKGNA